MRRLSFALDRGTPLEENPTLFGEGDSLEANPIRCGEGKPLEVNLIHLEKGTPWIGGDPPGGESHSLWRRLP